MHFDKPTYAVRKASRKKDIPKGLYTKDPVSGDIVFNKEVEDNQMVVPKSGHHFPIGARARIARFFDEDTFVECDASVKASDPLKFVDSQPYPERIKRYEKDSGLPEAVVCGTGKVRGIEVSVAVMDFRFCGGAMGSATGEKITRAIETAVKKKIPCIIFSASGGARMQEGIYSLMQMAKTSAALGRLAEAGLPYISVLTHPTMGGVTASFATLGDVIIAEPGALIGFAGARVIKDTTKQTLPAGFQTAEFLVKHGLVDQIVSRLELRDRIAEILAALYLRKNFRPAPDARGALLFMATGDAATYAAVTEYLFALKTRGGKFGIDRMTALTALIGYPERAVPCIHVAGTNGKGSVSAMLDAILHAAGWRTGLYTSPHLVKLGERVQVERQILSEREIVEYVGELRPLAEQLGAANPDDHPSFFEFMTGMAFLQFARKRCDISVIEVGLGGRLDATNIVTPEVSVITSIGMDHCEFLGDRLEQIASEKAGIIKTGCPVVIGRMPEEAERTIRAIAAERGARVICVKEVFGEDLAAYPHTNLEGEYQRWNAATATLVARELGAKWRITEAVIADGLKHVDWPGRWQRVQLGGRLTILDASHNPEGAQVLETSLKALAAETGRKPVVITGVLGAVRARPLLETISRYAKEIHLVVPQQSRACGYSDLEALIPASFNGRIVRATVEGLFPSPQVCTAGAADDVVVVTGSIYLLGEVMTRIEPQRGSGEGRLQDF